MCPSESSRPPIWSGWISPENLLSLVWNTAPFLRPQGGKPATEGFLKILHSGGQAEELQDYFALCLACHHATVATYVPTDVDSKIRGLLWLESKEAAVLHLMFDLTIEFMAWDLSLVSARTVNVPGFGIVSGHNGEHFSVLAGAHGRFMELGDAEYAEKSAAVIDAELKREADAFAATLVRRDGEIDVLKLAMSIAHNLGDLDQGIGFWRKGPLLAASRQRFHRLGHENTAPYGGTLRTAARLYSETLASEGHRHYPLRGVKNLRRSPDLLLPLSPFLDDWGATIARHPLLDHAARVETVEALVNGCRKIAGQTGYFRALAGFREAAPQEFEACVAGLTNAERKFARDAAFRKQLDVPRASFESTLRKKVAAIRK